MKTNLFTLAVCIVLSFLSGCAGAPEDYERIGETELIGTAKQAVISSVRTDSQNFRVGMIGYHGAFTENFCPPGWPTTRALCPFLQYWFGIPDSSKPPFSIQFDSCDAAPPACVSSDGKVTDVQYDPGASAGSSTVPITVTEFPGANGRRKGLKFNVSFAWSSAMSSMCGTTNPCVNTEREQYAICRGWGTAMGLGLDPRRTDSCMGKLPTSRPELIARSHFDSQDLAEMTLIYTSDLGANEQ